MLLFVQGITRNIPQLLLKSKRRAIICHDIKVGIFINQAIILDTPNPKNIPKIPPKKERTKDSIKNWIIISISRAPNAFLIPISLVRSVTYTSMIFIIPIPPTNKEIPAIALITKVTIPVTLFTLSISF